MDLHDSVAVVTGASQGIGRATARALVAAGARVAGLARSQDRLDQLAETLGDAFTPVVCDVTDADATEKAIDGVANDLGRLDVLVNNAGLGRFDPVDELSLDDWDAQVDTNLSGVFHCTRAAVPHMKAQGETRGPDATGRLHRQRGQHRRADRQPHPERLQRDQVRAPPASRTRP